MPASILHHLTVIGEAISRLPVELRERHPEVPWRQIIAVRHRIVHSRNGVSRLDERIWAEFLGQAGATGALTSANRYRAGLSQINVTGPSLQSDTAM
jgi:Protein of unknown function DUF86